MSVCGDGEAAAGLKQEKIADLALQRQQIPLAPTLSKTAYIYHVHLYIYWLNSTSFLSCKCQKITITAVTVDEPWWQLLRGATRSESDLSTDTQLN